MDTEHQGFEDLLALVEEQAAPPPPPTDANAEGPVEAIAEAVSLRLEMAELKTQLATAEKIIRDAAMAEHRRRVESGGDEQRVRFEGAHVDVKPTLTLGSLTEEKLRAVLGADFGQWFETRHSVGVRSTKSPVSRAWVVATVGEELTKALEAKIKFSHKLVPAKDVNTKRAQLAMTLPPAVKRFLAAVFDVKPILALGWSK